MKACKQTDHTYFTESEKSPETKKIKWEIREIKSTISSLFCKLCPWCSKFGLVVMVRVSGKVRSMGAGSKVDM